MTTFAKEERLPATHRASAGDFRISITRHSGVLALWRLDGVIPVELRGAALAAVGALSIHAREEAVVYVAALMHVGDAVARQARLPHQITSASAFVAPAARIRRRRRSSRTGAPFA